MLLAGIAGGMGMQDKMIVSWVASSRMLCLNGTLCMRPPHPTNPPVRL